MTLGPLNLSELNCLTYAFLSWLKMAPPNDWMKKLKRTAPFHSSGQQSAIEFQKGWWLMWSPAVVGHQTSILVRHLTKIFRIAENQWYQKVLIWSRNNFKIKAWGVLSQLIRSLLSSLPSRTSSPWKVNESVISLKSNIFNGFSFAAGELCTRLSAPVESI